VRKTVWSFHRKEPCIVDSREPPVLQYRLSGSPQRNCGMYHKFLFEIPQEEFSSNLASDDASNVGGNRKVLWLSAHTPFSWVDNPFPCRTRFCRRWVAITVSPSDNYFEEADFVEVEIDGRDGCSRVKNTPDVARGPARKVFKAISLAVSPFRMGVLFVPGGGGSAQDFLPSRGYPEN